MQDVKVNASFILPGRTLPAEPPCSKKGKKREKKKKKSSTMKSLEYTSQVIRLEHHPAIVINVRKTIPARQTVHLSSEAYQGMTDPDFPAQGMKPFEWKKLSPNKRLKINLQIMASSLGGELESFTVLDD